MSRKLQAIALLIGLAALILQFAITIPASMAAGRSAAGSLVFFFSFFTILTNIGVVLVHAAALTGSLMLSRLRSARWRGGVAVAISLVLIVYAAVLARLWQPQGLFLLADLLLHYATPVLYVSWWLAAGADGGTRWRDVPAWLAYPLAYFAYVLVRAPFAGEVPYPFLDIAANGFGRVALSALLVLGLFLLLSVLAVLADHALGRRRAKALP